VLGYVPQRDSLDPIYLLSSFEVVLMGTCGRVRPGHRIGHTEKEWAHQCLRETALMRSAKNFFPTFRRAEAAGPDRPRAGHETRFPAAGRTRRPVSTRPPGRPSWMSCGGFMSNKSLPSSWPAHDLPVVRAHVQHVIWLHHGNVLQGRSPSC